jgi:hypothetical protein
MLSKVLLGRVVIELLVLVMVFVAFDQMTSPSEGTATAVMEAVKKQQLDPISIVEVRSAIHSAGFLSVVQSMFGLLAFILLCSDLWIFWQMRRNTNSATHTTSL